jgi:hypothetical protein
MNRRAAEILERYRSAESLGEADRARLLVAIRERIAAGGSLPARPGDLTKPGELAKGGAGSGHAAGSALAKAAALGSKVVLGFALVAVPAAAVDAYVIYERPGHAQGASVAGASAAVTRAPVVAKHGTSAASSSATGGASAGEAVGGATGSPDPGAIPSIEADDLPPSGPPDARDRGQGGPAGHEHGVARGVADRAVGPHGSWNAHACGTPTLGGPSEAIVNGGGAAAGSLAAAASPSVESSPALAPAPASAAAPALTLAPTPTLAPSPSLPPASTSATAGATRGAGAGGGAVDEEVRLVSLAYSLLQAGDPTHALAVLDDHERRFPDGKLAESANVTRILALCQMGRASEARGERDRFLSRYPRSPFSSRVRSACAEYGSP